MAQITLTASQKATLEIQHKQSRNGKERDRIKAILLCSEGWSTPMIAQALRIHETSILRHIKEYEELEKLTIESGGSSSKLSAEQTEELISHLIEHTYHHQKDIVAYIKVTWSHEYTVSGLNKWLHQNKFSYKKPKGLPYKADTEKQAEFIQTYEHLKETIAADESIYFIDAVHPTQATKITSGWIRTGTDKPIKTTGSRTRVNIVGAIELGRIAEAVTSQYDTVNAISMMDFIETLRWESHTTGTIHLILDGAGYHRAQVLKDRAQELDIKLHYLPPYSPNLNPIERLWKVMNEKVRNNHCFHSAKEFRQRINDFFDNILPEIGKSLDTRINDNFQTFDPAFSS